VQGARARGAGLTLEVWRRYDRNDDYRLDTSEFEQLCSDAGRDLDREEAKAAMSAIDQDGNGSIDFNEFVRFWTSPEQTVQAAKDAIESDAEEQRWLRRA
jgi:Ca2+-binding EF-hand superfamily protein